jgi:hypothetical protein
MTRPAIISILGSLCLIVCAAAAQAQNTPSNSTPSPSSSTPSSSESSASTSSMSSQAHKPASGQQDTSRGAKEQQSQRKKCPKNGDTSNVNCKLRNKSSQ